MIDQSLDYNENAYQSPALKVFAKFVSYILHPLFIPTYIFIWLTWRFPIHFDNITAAGLTLKTISIFLNASFFPAFAVFLLWRLKFIENIFLRTQKERIVPYIITMIFYWWLCFWDDAFKFYLVILAGSVWHSCGRYAQTLWYYMVRRCIPFYFQPCCCAVRSLQAWAFINEK